MNHIPLLTDAEIERIRAAAIRALGEAGFCFQNDEILQRLERRGLKVDYARQRVYPTPADIVRLEECARRHAPPAEDQSAPLRRPIPAGESVGHNYACYYDYTEGQRRAATLADIRNVVKAWHMLPEIVATGPCMTAQDVPSPVEPIVSAAETMKLTDKIRSCPEMILGAQLPYLEELETIMNGRQVRYHTNGCSVNNFTMDERACDCLLAVARNGLEHWWVNSCPVAGANAPVTLAGAVTVGVAEMVGAWLAGWAMNEDVSLGCIPLCGVMDMRTTRVMFSTPETIVMDCALWQYFERVCGIHIGLCMGYTDAKVPGMQAINDKMLKGLAYAPFVGYFGGQTGTLEAGNTYSPNQQVIDLELNRQIAQLTRGLEVTDETLPVNEIVRAAAGEIPTFLTHDHTLEHWRGSLWTPRLMDRTAFGSPEDERCKEMQIVERAEARWRDALARYRPPEMDEARLKAIDEVAAHARHTLLGG